MSAELGGSSEIPAGACHRNEVVQSPTDEEHHGFDLVLLRRLEMQFK